MLHLAEESSVRQINHNSQSPSRTPLAAGCDGGMSWARHSELRTAARSDGESASVQYELIIVSRDTYILHIIEFCYSIIILF